MPDLANLDLTLDKAHQPTSVLPLQNPDLLDFSKSALYVNRTKRFVLPIPELAGGGEPLVFPAGTEQAGRAIKALDDGTPERGIVFANGEDRAWQAVRGNGKEAILFTDVSLEQAQALQRFVKDLEQQNGGLTLEDVKAVLQFARSELNLVDCQNKKMESVPKEMKVIDPNNPYFMQVIKDTKHQAVYIPTGFTFDGPVRQTYPEGAVILTDGKYKWGIGKQVFIRNFMRLDAGKEIPLVSLENEFGSSEANEAD